MHSDGSGGWIGSVISGADAFPLSDYNHGSFDRPPDSVLYNPYLESGSTLTVTANGPDFGMGESYGWPYSEPYTSNMIWGYRDMYTADEKDTQEAVLKPDYTEPAADAAQLVVTYDDNTGKGTVQKIDANGETPKNACAVIRGYFSDSVDSLWYECRSGTVSLSPTLTLAWDASSNSCFRVKKSDGSIELLNMKPELSTPGFKCYYAPDLDTASAGTNLEFEYNDKPDSGKELTVRINNTDKNKAVFSCEYPGASLKVDSISAKPNGSIAFGGKVALKTLFNSAALQLNRLQYGPNANGSFVYEGFCAEASLSDVSLFGLGINSANVLLNTIPGEKCYSFEVDVDAFGLMSFDGALTLKTATKGAVKGMLFPNRLWIDISSDAVGIPIIPPVVVGEINGGGFGFDNLVDTINGDWRAIPPISLTGSVHVKLLKLIEGTMKLTVSPAGLRMSGEDLKLADLEMIKQLEKHYVISGKQLRYKNVLYTGLNLDIGMSAQMSLPTGMKRWNDIFVVGGSVSVGGFGGLGTKNGKKQLYVSLDSTGSITGSVQVPGGIRLIGGKTLASTTIQYNLGLMSAVDFTDFKSALDNANGYFGAAWAGSFLNICYACLYYVTPDKVGIDVGFGSGDDLEEYQEALEEASGVAVLQGLDNEENIGLCVSEINSSLLSTAQLMAGASEQTLNLPGDANVRTQDSLFLQLQPTDPGVSLTELFSRVRVDGVSPVLMTTDDNGRWAGGNALIDAPDVENGAVYICLKQIGSSFDSSKTSWTVSGDGLGFSAALCQSKPFDKLSADLNKSAHRLSVSAENLNKNADYVIRVYYGNEKNSGSEGCAAEYKLPAGSVQADTVIELPSSGSEFASGDYYVVASLLKRTELGENETTLVPLSTLSFDDTVSYQNEHTPNAVKNVGIAASGNETMTISWTANDSLTAPADGYRLTLYRQDGDDWINTGVGLMITADDVDRLSGVTYDSASKTYTVLLAVTAGNAADALKADCSYKAAVEAYHILSDEDSEESCSVYGSAAESGSAYLAACREAQLTVCLNDEPLAADPETGVYTVVFGPETDTLRVSSADSRSYRFTLSAEDSSLDFGYPDKKGSSAEWELSDAFEGCPMLALCAVSDTDGSSSFLYLKLASDRTPPSLIPDSESFVAEADGSYTVSGSAEPGAVISIGPASTTAGKDGRFTLTHSFSPVSMSYPHWVIEYDEFSEEVYEEYDEWYQRKQDGWVCEQEWSGGAKTYEFCRPVRFTFAYEEMEWFDSIWEEFSSAECRNLRKYSVVRSVPYNEEQYHEMTENGWEVTLSDKTVSAERVTIQALDSAGNRSEASAMIFSTQPEPLHSVMPLSAAGSVSENGTLTVQLTLIGEKGSTVEIFVAVYDENGRFLGAKKETHSFDEDGEDSLSVSADRMGNASDFKILLSDGLLSPVSAVLEGTIP